MRNKEDLRVKKTKKALSEAFLELLSQKKFDEITINELCEKADVRRATFYKHYSDKFHFLTSYVSDLRDDFEKKIWKSKKPGATKEYYVTYAKQIVLFISEHEAPVKNIFKSSMFPSAMSIIVEQNYLDTCERLIISEKEGMKLPASVEVVASMCAGGVANAIYHWLMEGEKLTRDELANQIGSVVCAAIGQK